MQSTTLFISLTCHEAEPACELHDVVHPVGDSEQHYGDRDAHDPCRDTQEREDPLGAEVVGREA